MSRHVPIAVIISTIVILGAPAFAQDKPKQGADLVQQGMKVYADRKCSICHAIGGKGNSKGPLDEVGAKLTADEIRAWLVTPKEMTAKTKAERKPAMLPYSDLSKSDVEALVAYQLTLKKAPGAAGTLSATTK